MEIVKNEIIKEEVADIDIWSPVKVGADIEYTEKVTLRCEIPGNKLDLESIKYEEERIIKTEINHIKDELDTEGHELCYEQLESIKTEDYKIQSHDKCYGLSNQLLDFCHEQYIKDIKSMKREQNVEKDYACDMQNSELYQCSNCKYKAKVKKLLIRHCRMQHNKELKWHNCHLCDFKTKYKQHLQHHSIQHDDAAEIFHCELCDFKTKHKVSLFRHHRIKHDYSAGSFHCNLCDFKTKNKSYLLQYHRLKHDDSTEIFCCKLCDYQTKIKKHLLQHQRLKHDDAAEVFHCELCDYKTKYKSGLSRHCRFKHDNAAENFFCELCDFKTKYKKYLWEHHRVRHSDMAEIFHCDLCDFKTKHKNSLLRHYKSKHDVFEIFIANCVVTKQISDTI